MARFSFVRTHRESQSAAGAVGCSAGAGNHGARWPRRFSFLSALLISVVLSATAAFPTTYTISPGLDSLQYYITNRCNHASGDVIILNNGTYTFTPGSNCLIFTSGVTGTTFTNLTIRAANPGLATLDFATASFDAIFGGDAQGVTIKDVVWSGSPGQAFLRDQAGSAYTNWTFDGITLTATTKVGIKITAVTGVGITIKNITTTSTYSAPQVVYIAGPASDLDLLIDGVDGRVHARGTPNTLANSPMYSVVHLENVRDARVKNIKGYFMRDQGFQIVSTDNAKQCRNIYVSDVWINRSMNAGVHVGNTTAGVARTSNVHLRNIRVENIADGYGIEFENSAYDCSLVGFYISKSQRMGAVLAECTENIEVTGGYIYAVQDSIGGAPGATQSSGIVTSTGRRHRIVNNTIDTCVRGFVVTYDTTQVNPADGGSYSGSWTTTQRTVIKDNAIVNCNYVYDVQSKAMPQGGGRPNAHMIGPNIATTPVTAFSLVNGNPRTQAQWESQFAHNIDKADIVVGSWPPFGTNTESACRLVNPDGTPTGYTLNEALTQLLKRGVPIWSPTLWQ